MTVIPGWARLIGAVLGAALLTLGAFVTRYEYAAHVEWGRARNAEIIQELQVIHGDIKRILWHVGGEGAHFAAPLCQSEAGSPPAVARYLDGLWTEVVQRAKARKPPKRPEFCFLPGAIFVPGTTPEPDRLLGFYDKRTHTVLVALFPGELARHLRCVALHEMAHALLGPKEGPVNALLPECVPGIDP